MSKTILITGASDGIGLETARQLSAAGHSLILHGRNPEKLDRVAAELGGKAQVLVADMSDLPAVGELGRQAAKTYPQIDILINNAGVYKTNSPLTPNGQDVRFVVNTLAPALLTRSLLPSIPADGRIVHLSSAAQAPVDLSALAGDTRLGDMAAYAQSKLALTMWSQSLAAEIGPDGPVTVAVNPGSLLATNLVRTGFGIAGNDIGIGADILSRAALSDEFAHATGRYFDNDSGAFAPPHPDAANPGVVKQVVAAIEARIAEFH